MAYWNPKPRIIHSTIPRHIRRLIRHGFPQSNYVREEYLTSLDRNIRYEQLRLSRARHLTKYSDINSAGVNVFVVAFVPDVDIKNLEISGAENG